MYYRLKLFEPPIAIGAKKDYIALVNLYDYFRFIADENGELIKHIFESNVRDYQGSTTVNGEIQETLNENTREDFWWLNNGVTVLASETIQATGKELIITDPEIVNGLQTSTEIYNFFSNNKDKVDVEKRCVLVRIIVPENDESRDKIILATNSQTNIPKASLRTTDPIHRQIELYLKTKGLYYDRRKNYYKNQGKKSNDIVSVPFLAQCLMSILLQKPDHARARPSTYYYLMKRTVTSDEETGKVVRGVKIGNTKTPKSVRTIAIPDVVAEVITDWKDYCATNNIQSEFVFPTKKVICVHIPACVACSCVS